MEYYLLPVEDDEAVAVEDALKKINYDVLSGAKKLLIRL